MIIRGFLLRDPAGARTQDPNIKSVVLYLLKVEHFFRTPKHFKHFSYLCAIINNIQSLIYG